MAVSAIGDLKKNSRRASLAMVLWLSGLKLGREMGTQSGKINEYEFTKINVWTFIPNLILSCIKILQQV